MRKKNAIVEFRNSCGHTETGFVHKISSEYSYDMFSLDTAQAQ